MRIGAGLIDPNSGKNFGAQNREGSSKKLVHDENTAGGTRTRTT